MKKEKLQVRYTSGTGNTHRLIKWVEEEVLSKGWITDIQAVEIEGSEKLGTSEEPSTLLLATPTHGFTTPWTMLYFAFKLPKGNGNYAYCLASRAGFRLGEHIINGIAGTCAYFLALVLFFKGYRVRGVIHINMPSNWFTVHSVQGEKTVAMINEQGKAKVESFCEKLILDKVLWINGNNIYEAICGALLLPISLIYLCMGRIGLAKLYFSNYRCDGCGLCVELCPTRSIVLMGREKTRPFWKHSCENCMRCAAFCPKGAIEASHSWLIILSLITSTPVWIFLITQLGNYFPVLNGLEQSWFSEPLKLIFSLLVYIVAYWVFHLLLWFRPINRLFSYTTLTHYWGRYKARGFSLKDLRSDTKKKMES